MRLRWEHQSSGRWHGFDASSARVGFVAEVIATGGATRYWTAWRRDGSPDGNDVGSFTSARAAMAPVDLKHGAGP